MPSEAALRLQFLLNRIGVPAGASIAADIAAIPTAPALVADGWDAALATILDNFTAINIGYLSELDFDLAGAIAALPAVMVGTDGAATVADGWDAALATILDNFSAVNIGYLDELDFDLQTTLSTLQTDISEGKLRAFRHTYIFAFTTESVSNAAEVSLAAPATISPAFPAGATLLRATVIGTLKANNQSDNAHNILVTLQYQVAAGGWNDIGVVSANEPLSLPDVTGTADALLQGGTLVFTTGQAVEFRFQVDSDDANEVHYAQTFVLSVEYDFQ